jgi:outer membrane protein TolC
MSNLRTFLCAIAIVFSTAFPGKIYAQNSTESAPSPINIDSSEMADIVLPPLSTFLEAIESTPQIELLKSQRIGLQIDFKDIKNEWMERINVAGNYSYGKGTSLSNTSTGSSTDPILNYYNNVRSTYAIGIGIGLPISYFSVHKGKIKKQKELLKQADFVQLQTLQQIKLQVVEIYTNLEMLLKSRKKNIELLYISNTLLRMKSADYVNGMIDLNEYSTIVSNQKSIQSEMDATTAQIIKDKYQLEILTGVNFSNQLTE